MEWGPPAEIATQAGMRLERRNAELAGELRKAENAARKQLQGVAAVFVSSLVPETQARMQVYEKYIATATRDLITLFDQYATLSPEAGGWIEMRVNLQIDAAKDALGRQIEQATRIQSLGRPDFAALRDSVATWSYRLKDGVAQKVRLAVGER